MNSISADEACEQRRRVRRSALLWGLIAAAFYLGFIVMTLVRGWR
jgi:predicted nucleic acid-binding Zn ribbon protein